MRTINFRFVAVTLLIVLLIGGAVHAVHVMQYGKHIQFLKTLADGADKAGDDLQAIDHYRRYVALQRTDAAAYERLGDLLNETGRPREAQAPLMSAFNLLESKGSEEDLLRLRRKLADAALASRRWSDAEYQLGILMTANPGDARLHEDLAICDMGEGRWANAAEKLRSAIRLDPARETSYALLAEIEAEQLEHADRAVECLNELVTRNPDSAEAWLIRGAFRHRGVNRTADDVRRAEAFARAKAKDVPPLEPRELLELATADAQRAVELATAGSSPPAGDEVDDDSEAGNALELRAVTLSMLCQQLSRQTSDAQAAQRHREQAQSLARRLIELCEAKYRASVQQAVERSRLRAQEEAKASGQTVSDEELDQSSGLSGETDSLLKRQAYLAAVPAYIVLADIALRSGDSAESMKILNDGLQRVGEVDELMWNLGNLMLMAGLDAIDNPDFRRLVQRLSDNPRSEPLAQYLNARLLLARRSTTEALRALEAVRSHLAPWPGAVVEADTWIGLCLLESGRAADAQTAYNRALNSDPSSTPARWGLARALEEQGRDAEALQHYQMLARRFDNLQGGTLRRDLIARLFRLASTRLRQASANDAAWENVLSDLHNIRRENAGDAELLEELTCVEVQLETDRGRPERARTVVQEAAERSPQSIRLWTTLARMCDFLKDPAAAELALQSIDAALTDQTPAQAAALQRARIQHLLVVKGKEAAGDIREAIAALPELPADDQARRVQLQLLEDLANLALYVGDVETATGAFETIRKADRNNARVRIQLFDLALQAPAVAGEDAAQRRARWDEKLKGMDGLLQEMEASSDRDDALLNYGHAVSHIVNAELIQSSGSSPVDRQKVAEQYARALERLSVAANASPRWGMISHLQGLILYNQQQREKAADAWLRAVRNDYRNPEFVSRLVVLLFELQRFDEAAKLLVDLKADEAPRFIELAQAAAGVSSAMHNDTATQTQLLDLAVAYAEKSAAGSDNPAHHLAYAQILLMDGDIERAEQEFQRIRELAPSDRTVWLKLIQTYKVLSQSGQMPADAAAAKIRESLAAAEKVLPPDELGVVVGQSLWELGDTDAARDRFRSEMQGVPSDLRQATAGQIELMRRAAEFFVTDIKHPESVQYGEELLRRFHDEGARVRAELQSAREAAQDRASAAITPLEAALAEAVPLARRQLATVVMSRKGNEGLKEAFDLVEANKSNGVLADDDARMEAVILSRSNSRDQRLLAISRLRNLVNVRLPRNEDRMLLATLAIAEHERAKQELKLKRTLYGDAAVRSIEIEAQGLLREARSQTDAIVLAGTSPRTGGPNPDAPQVDASYIGALMLHIDILLRSGNTTDAQEYLRRLKELHPDANATAMTEAGVQFTLGNHDAVIDLMTGLASAEAEDVRNAQLGAVAKLLEGLGIRAQTLAEAGEGGDPAALSAAAARYFGATEKILVQLAGVNAESQLVLAGFYGRRARADEALSLLETHWQSASAGAIAATGTQIMSGVGRAAEPAERLSVVVTAALEQHPEDVSLRLLLADLKGWQARLDVAERLYREVLSKVPNHVIAANNLAYLLASQQKAPQEALELISSVIKVRGELPELLDTKAYVLLQSGDTAGALADLAKAIQEAPRADYLYHSARAKLAAGQIKEAGEDWQLATRGGLNEETMHPAELDELREFKAQLAN